MQGAKMGVARVGQGMNWGGGSWKRGPRRLAARGQGQAMHARAPPPPPPPNGKSEAVGRQRAQLGGTGN